LVGSLSGGAPGFVGHDISSDLLFLHEFADNQLDDDMAIANVASSMYSR